MLQICAGLDSDNEISVRATIIGLIILLLLLGWRLERIVYGSSTISRITAIAGFPTYLSECLSGIHYVFAGPDIILKTYHKAGKRPCAVATPENHLVLVSSEEQVKELSQAPESQLSLHAIAKDMFQPKYTMYGFEVHDQMPENGSMHFRVLRTLLTANLPRLQSVLQQQIEEAFSLEVAGARSLNEAGWKSIATFMMAKRLVAKVNSYIFVGKELCTSLAPGGPGSYLQESSASKPEYMEAALKYPQDVFITGEALRLTPTLLAPLVAAIMTRGSRSANILVAYLTPLVKARIAKRPNREGQRMRPTDCLQWIIDSSPRKDPWTPEKIVQETLALWFGSVHQLAMSLVYVLYDLCEHQQYVEPLRQEIEEQAKKGWQDCLECMPLLDSFLKESARLNPSDSISVRRKVLSPYTFADGTHIPSGNWVCVPQQAIMRDPESYPKPTSFDGFRFVDKSDAGTGGKVMCTSPFTTIDHSFPFWGAGKRACPGRFFASAALKLMVAHILSNYDFKFADRNQKRTFSWRSAVIPRSDLAILFRERGNSG